MKETASQRETREHKLSQLAGFLGMYLSPEEFDIDIIAGELYQLVESL